MSHLHTTCRSTSTSREQYRGILCLSRGMEVVRGHCFTYCTHSRYCAILADIVRVWGLWRLPCCVTLILRCVLLLILHYLAIKYALGLMYRLSTSSGLVAQYDTEVTTSDHVLLTSSERIP